jgi:hypothetical protein
MNISEFDSVLLPFVRGKGGRMPDEGIFLKSDHSRSPLTLALSPRKVVYVLRNSLAGERGQIAVSLITTFQAA